MKKLLLVLILSLLGTALYAQTDLAGTWNTGKENTLVKIYEKEGIYFGEIISSDNPNVEIGKQIVKDVKSEKENWKGKLYLVAKQKWADAKMVPADDKLTITVSRRRVKRTVEWTRVKTETEAEEAKTEEKEADKEESEKDQESAEKDK
jgi:hypothetical protein